MKWQFGFNPNTPYNTEMYPSPIQHDPKAKKIYSHIPKGVHRYKNDIGLGIWLQGILGIAAMIYMAKFFFLIVAPLIPASVIVYEIMDEILVQKIVIVYGISFITAYLLYWCYKVYFVSLSSFILKLLYIVCIYALNILATFFLETLYPENKVLKGLVEEFNMFIAF